MSTALGYVAAVNIVIWAGIFGYLIYLDRRVRAAETARSGGENTR
jgi:CcmD family protein